MIAVSNTIHRIACHFKLMHFLSAILLVSCLAYNTEAQAKPFGAKICTDSSKFTCYKVKRGDTWEKLFDDDETQIAAVKRINRINIRLRPGMTIAIPHESNVDYMDYSPLSRSISPPGDRIIVVSKRDLAWGAYDEQGTLVRWGALSGGKGYCPDTRSRCNTPTGKFAIYQKKGAGCVSSKFPIGKGGAPMPYCMFFYGGYALHGSYDVPGYHASHGCVRIFVDDAEWLNQEFADHGTRVYITNE